MSVNAQPADQKGPAPAISSGTKISPWRNRLPLTRSAKSRNFAADSQTQKQNEDQHAYAVGHEIQNVLGARIGDGLLVAVLRTSVYCSVFGGCGAGCCFSAAPGTAACEGVGRSGYVCSASACGRAMRAARAAAGAGKQRALPTRTKSARARETAAESALREPGPKAAAIVHATRNHRLSALRVGSMRLSAFDRNYSIRRYGRPVTRPGLGVPARVTERCAGTV